MNIILLVVLAVIPLASLSLTVRDVPNEPYSHIAEIHVDGLACVGVLYGKKCILTSAKCADYCEDSVYIRTYNPSEKRYMTNRVVETYTNSPFFNVRDMGVLVLRNPTNSVYLDNSLILPNTNVKGELVYKSLRYSEEVNIEPSLKCSDEHGKYFSPSGSICATQTVFREECYAPTGSPLFSNNRLVGIASWCESLANKAQEYMVYTDVTHKDNLKFLNETAWSHCN